jgi:hypothetical protein
MLQWKYPSKLKGQCGVANAYDVVIANSIWVRPWEEKFTLFDAG